MVHIDAFVSNARHVARQEQGIFHKDARGQKVEFGDKRVLDPVRQEFPAPNVTTRAQKLKELSAFHALTIIQQQHETQKQAQLEAFTNVGRGQFEQGRSIVLFKDGRLDFGKIARNEQGQEGLVGRVHGDIQGSHVTT